MDSKIKIIIYLSSWTVAWYILSSIINAGLLQVKLYEAHSKLEFLVFFIIAIFSLASSLLFSSEFFSDSRETGGNN